MRRDRIVAQHRVALLQQIANAEQGEAAENHDGTSTRSNALRSAIPKPSSSTVTTRAGRQNDEAWRERKHQRFHGIPSGRSCRVILQPASLAQSFERAATRYRADRCHGYDGGGVRLASLPNPAAGDQSGLLRCSVS